MAIKDEDNGEKIGHGAGRCTEGNRNAYDAFGNRTLKEDYSGGKPVQTMYQYNAANQLVSHVEEEKRQDYSYDRRGNLSLITADGALKNRYTYGTINRLEQAVNGNGEAAFYTYNGLGHRVGKMAGPETKIQYTIDLTKSYHNLLQKEEGGDVQTYLWDGNVAGIAGDGGRNERYYLKDELGSPIRLISESGELEETYGYDEFGQDLYGNQGVTQPFGYTGYQADRTAGTYYAQAREYKAELGKFAAVDAVKGFVIAPYTLNEYGYCWNNPMMLADLDGRFPSLSDIGRNLKSTASSAVDAISDIAIKAVTPDKDAIDKAIITVRNSAQEVKEAADEFYDEHKKAIDTTAKVLMTVEISALVVLGTIAILAAAPAGIMAATAVTLGAGILSIGMIGGVTGGISNIVTGGSFLNGYCGGFVNGTISGAGTALTHPVFGNFAGGFVGNTMTEAFNNMDIDDPQERKGTSDILTTSLLAGGVQAATAMGPIAALGKGGGASDISSQYIAEFFAQDLIFCGSLINYIFANGMLECMESEKDKNEAECIE